MDSFPSIPQQPHGLERKLVAQSVRVDSGNIKAQSPNSEHSERQAVLKGSAC